MLNAKYIADADGSLNSNKILNLIYNFQENPLTTSVIVMPKEESWNDFYFTLNYDYQVALVYDGQDIFGWSVFTSQLLEQQRILNRLQRPFHEYCVKRHWFLTVMENAKPNVISYIALIIFHYLQFKPAEININTNYLQNQFVINDEGFIACKGCFINKRNPIFHCTQLTNEMMIQHLQSETHLKCIKTLKSKNVNFQPIV